MVSEMGNAKIHKLIMHQKQKLFMLNTKGRKAHTEMEMLPSWQQERGARASAVIVDVVMVTEP